MVVQLSRLCVSSGTFQQFCSVRFIFRRGIVAWPEQQPHNRTDEGGPTARSIDRSQAWKAKLPNSLTQDLHLITI